MEDIKVKIVEFGDRKHYQMQYVDPASGKKKTKSSGVERSGKQKDRTKAERAAAAWEAELRAGRYRQPSKITWEEFRRRYEDEVLPGLAEETGRVLFTVFNTVESILKPNRLRELTTERLSYYQAELRRTGGAEIIEPSPSGDADKAIKRKVGRSENTIRTYLAHLKAALRWAVSMGWLSALPEIHRPKRAKGCKMMKGRPITTEEFERMIEKVPAIFKMQDRQGRPSKLPPGTIEAWRHYLKGMWWSGLRLAESLNLYWDRHDRLCVDLSGKRPMLRVRAELEKGNEDRLLPIAPEFAEFLLATPEPERVGRVFKLPPRRKGHANIADDWVGRIVSRIGKAAGVKVDVNPKTGKVKYASAHDLRRSFGHRWAPRVMPTILQELMRHEDIETTMKFYVGRNAETTADAAWNAYFSQASGNTSGNTGSSGASAQNERPVATSSHDEPSVSRGDRI